MSDKLPENNEIQQKKITKEFSGILPDLKSRIIGETTEQLLMLKNSDPLKKGMKEYQNLQTMEIESYKNILDLLGGFTDINQIDEIVRKIKTEKLTLIEKLTNLKVSQKELKNMSEKITKIENLILLFKNINGRDDINNIDFFTKLLGIKIDKKIVNLIIEKGYYFAFLKEFQGKGGKQSLKNLIKYGNVWKNDFKSKLSKFIGDEKAEELFMLVFIESNAMQKKESEYGAIGFFQMLPETAKNYGMKSVSDLNNPQKAGKIAANYLANLLEKTGGDIKKALLLYNGAWSDRLKDIYTGDIQETILSISKNLNYVKTLLNKKKGGISEKEAIVKIKEIENKYFKSKGEGVYNLGILEKGSKSKKSIISWINRYIPTVLMQQYMYPEQIKSSIDAFNKVKK